MQYYSLNKGQGATCLNWMVQAWMYAETAEGPRELHQTSPIISVTTKELLALGVQHWAFDPVTQRDKVDKIARERGYSSNDTICISPSKMADYEQKLQVFFSE